LRPAESEVFGVKKFLSDEQIICQILNRATPKSIPLAVARAPLAVARARHGQAARAGFIPITTKKLSDEATIL